MILPKIPGTRHNGFNGMEAANPVNKGRFMYNAGQFLATHAPIGTAGFSNLNDGPRMLTANATTSGVGVFPVNKLILQLEGADQALDTIASGASLIFYEGGQYETDEYDVTVSGTGTVPGDKLWLNANGQITLTASATALSIGEVVQVSALPATTRWWTGGTAGSKVKTVWYKLYPRHAQPHTVGGQTL
jgi:hypothetical protein